MSLVKIITTYLGLDKKIIDNVFDKEQTYHLVLSGGGLKGFAHIGVYKALVEHGYVISSVAGTSMGSLIGLFIAAGKSPQEIEEIFCRQSVYKFLNVVFSKEGMLSAQTIQSTIDKEIRYKNIEDLPLSLTVCATDIDQAEPIYYTQGDIKKIVTGSCAVPGIFKPISYDGRYLVDGGIYDNMPVSTSHGLPIIGSHVNPLSQKVKHSAQGVTMRALRLLISRDIRRQQQECEVFFEPPKLATVGQALFVSPKKIVQIGYDHAMSVLGPLRKKS